MLKTILIPLDRRPQSSKCPSPIDHLIEIFIGSMIITAPVNKLEREVGKAIMGCSKLVMANEFGFRKLIFSGSIQANAVL